MVQNVFLIPRDGSLEITGGGGGGGGDFKKKKIPAREGCLKIYSESGFPLFVQ